MHPINIPGMKNGVTEDSHRSGDDEWEEATFLYFFWGCIVIILSIVSENCVTMECISRSVWSDYSYLNSFEDGNIFCQPSSLVQSKLWTNGSYFQCKLPLDGVEVHFIE